MKKVRLLCLLALLFAVGSAFTTMKDGPRYRAVSTGPGLDDYAWVPENEVEGDCEIIKNSPCFIQLTPEADPPVNGTVPPSGDLEDKSEKLSAYP